jgi:hypothetical protein
VVVVSVSEVVMREGWERKRVGCEMREGAPGSAPLRGSVRAAMREWCLPFSSRDRYVKGDG